MTGRVPSTARARAACLLAIAVAGLGASGCGGGSDGPSKQDYEATVNTFCANVKSAAQQVQSDASKLQASAAKDPQKAVRNFGSTLSTFADSMQSAVDKLRKADPPKQYRSFNDRAVTAFTGVVGKLRGSAKGAKAGDISALSTLGQALGSVKLPDLPADIAKHAKACRDISS